MGSRGMKLLAVGLLGVSLIGSPVLVDRMLGDGTGAHSVVDCGALGTGLLKNTTGTGAWTIGVAGTDFAAANAYVPGGTDVAVADGGTGASTANLGYNALSPNTTRGDITVRGASTNGRLGIGTIYQCLVTTDGVDLTWGHCGPLFSSQTVDPASCAASSVCRTAVTVTGAAANDICRLGPPATLLAGVTVDCFVSAANTVQLEVNNPTTAAKDVLTGTWTFQLSR